MDLVKLFVSAPEAPRDSAVIPCRNALDQNKFRGVPRHSSTRLDSSVPICCWTSSVSSLIASRHAAAARNVPFIGFVEIVIAHVTGDAALNTLKTIYDTHTADAPFQNN